MDSSQLVPPGYKLTEVGVIPEEWEVRAVKNFGEVVTGSTPPTTNTAFWSGEFPWITPTDITTRRDIYNGERCISTLGMKVVRPLPADTVLVTCIASIGKNAILKTVGACNQQINAVVPDINHNPVFLYYLFEHNKAYLIGNSGITATRIISKRIFEQLVFALPPTLAEQEAIAAALSDADALIEALEQLIAKKRQVKQGTMQELLTGKRRLPGFSGEWGIVHLRDLLLYERPDRYIVQDAEYSERGEVPVLTANKSFILGYTVEDFGICRDLPVIVFDDFTTDSKFADFPFKVKSSAIKLLRPKHERVDLRFVFGCIQLIRFALGDHKRYYISEYQNLELSVPDYEEQTAVAAILSDMDAEIAALEEKLAKARQVKQGMMQELLTGRIRLL